MNNNSRIIYEPRQSSFNSRFLFAARYVPVLIEAFNKDNVCVFWNEAAAKISGYSAKETVGNPMAYDLLYPDGRERNTIVGTFPVRGYDFVSTEWTMTAKDGVQHTISWFNLSKFFKPLPEWDFWAMGVDITARLQAEAELEQKNKVLGDQAKRLVETNSALKVIIENNDDEQKRQVAEFITNLDKLLLPFLAKLQQTELTNQQDTLVKIIIENVYACSRNMGGQLVHLRNNLTVTEFEIAVMIVHGQLSSEIAQVLGTSVSTIAAHRRNIRRKLYLTKKGINLAMYLRSAFLDT